MFVVNNDRSFLSHRATWASAFQAAGAPVILAAQDTGRADRVRDLLIEFHSVALGRENVSPFRALVSSLQILFLILRRRPGVVILSATTAYSLGWFAAPFLRDTTFLRVAGGIGRALTAQHDRSTAAQTVRGLIRCASRLSNVYTLFQTREDAEFFQQNGLAFPERSFTIPGTGISPESWPPAPDQFTRKPVTVLFASRLYEEKGIYEYVEAARAMRDSGLIFQVAGEPDDGVSTAVPWETYAAWQAEGIVEMLGHRDDMHDVYTGADILVFPSRHPEGTPRVLIEAACVGLPCIVSDQPGCRAVVKDSITGVLLSDLSSTSIVRALSELVSNPERAHAMGQRARAYMGEAFSLDFVVSTLFSELVGASTPGKLGKS